MTRRSSASNAIEPAPRPMVPTVPKDQVLARLAWIKTAPIAALKDEWHRLYGKEPPPFSRSYITRRLSYRLQELAYGGLKPETRARLAWQTQDRNGKPTKVPYQSTGSMARADSAATWHATSIQRTG